MVLLSDFSRGALAFTATEAAAGTVSPTSLYQEATWPKYGICPFQLLP